MRAIILAGGRGTRLAPYTTVFPKPLVPVGDRPILDIVLRQLAANGFDDISLAVGHLAELIEAYCGDGSRYGISITYSREDAPLGTAGPIALVEPPLETFLVMNGDLLTAVDFPDMLATHRADKAIATVATIQRDVRIDLGVVDVDASEHVIGYREKPVFTFAASTGIYFLEPAVLDYIPRGQRLDLPDLVLQLAAGGQVVRRYASDAYWLDIGRPDDYAEAIRVFEADPGRFIPSSG
ncbi:MAG: sugar phosphate nucleotidyltransferase [Chloroflexota bacterium]